MNTGRLDDIARIAHQEDLLQWRAFDNASAFELGLRLKAACESAGVATTLEIRLGRRTVFFYAMPGTAPGHADWARRKRNVVELLERSSYAVGLSAEEEGQSIEASMGLSARDYAAHGGSFPLRVKGVGCVGVATLSGLPQREDHDLLVGVLASLCGVDATEIALRSQ